MLHVPDLKFNLLSISEHTRQLSFVVTFLPDFCIFQALSNGNVLRICREREGLYILKGCIPSTVNTLANSSTKITNSIEDTLWHYSLGHPSGASMHNIESLPKKIHPHVHDHYDICPLVNQHQLTFPVHSTKVVALFDLVHLDV